MTTMATRKTQRGILILRRPDGPGVSGEDDMDRRVGLVGKSYEKRPTQKRAGLSMVMD